MNKEREKKKGKELGIRVRCWKYLSREGRRTNCEEEEQEGIAPSIKKCSNYLAMSCCCLKKSDRSQSELIWAPTAEKETNWQIVHPCHFLQNFQLIVSRNTYAHKRIQTKMSPYSFILQVLQFKCKKGQTSCFATTFKQTECICAI